MAQIQIESLNQFIATNVGITIYDDTWTDQSPLRSEKVKKVTYCPNETHIRVYFNERQFFAIPRTAKVTETSASWTAIDEEGGLHYVIQKETFSTD